MLIDTYDKGIYYKHNAYFNGSQTDEMVFFEYYGRKGLLEFLKRIYDFDSIYSAETSFENELIRHTVANDDYEYKWVFYEDRLQLENGNDEILLKFLCEMFHPVVRNEKSNWINIFEKINELIKVDGYELYEVGKISNRSVFGYRHFI